jgi:hypothetical protein
MTAYTPPAAGDTFVSNQDRGCGNLYHLPLFALQAAAIKWYYFDGRRSAPFEMIEDVVSGHKFKVDQEGELHTTFRYSRGERRLYDNAALAARRR